MNQRPFFISCLLGVTILSVSLGVGCSEKSTQSEDVKTDSPKSYTVFEKPEALTWAQRAEKKRRAGQIDIALDYYDRALAVNVKDVSYGVALILWQAEGDMPFTPDKVETIVRSLPQPRQRNMFARMGRDYLNGVTDTIPKDETNAIRLLTEAKDMGNLDARLLLEGHKTGRTGSFIGDTQFSDEVFEVDLSGINQESSVNE